MDTLSSDGYIMATPEDYEEDLNDGPLDDVRIDNSSDGEGKGKNKGHDDEGFLASPKRLVPQVRLSFVKALNDLMAVSHDEHLKEEVESHTEEEVAGMKLCVSEVVHQDSFTAPC